MEFLNNINSAVLVIGTVLITLAVAGIVGIVARSKRADQTYFENAQQNWDKIRPILVSLTSELIKLDASKGSYDTVLNYSVKYVKGGIDKSDLLTSEEKQLFSEDIIRQLLDPWLKKLWNSGFQEE